MNARMRIEADQAGNEPAGIDQIVVEFGQWVKGVSNTFNTLRDESDVQRLEEEIRTGGQRILLRLMQQVVQQAVDARQESTRICPEAQCRQRRRHQGVRRRKLSVSLGELEVSGIYWRCPACGRCDHSAEGIAPQTMSRLFRGLVCLAGTALSSFKKGQIVLQKLMGVSVDDETIRRRCQSEGWALTREADAPPTPVEPGQQLTASSDGTMVHTREGGWREVKAYRFEHANGRYGGAYLEPVEEFSPRVGDAAERVGHRRTDHKVFLSDMAEWIKQMAAQRLPGWIHVADIWHAGQHIHHAAEAIYGVGNRKTARWSSYWSRRLRLHGASVLADKLRRIVMHYRGAEQQESVLVLIRFLEKHAANMDYPRFEAMGLPISSGPMESFCKQIGLRMKGPGMHWSAKNVTPMGMLVSRWSMDPGNASVFGAMPPRAA